MKFVGKAIAALAFSLGLLVTLAVPAMAQETGIAVKRPVFAGACHYCPWGAMGDVVKAAMKPYGYDVQSCYQCATTLGPRQVSEARVPMPRVRPPGEGNQFNIMAPQDPLPKGPVDFGATSVQNLRRAYEGRGDYAKEGPRTNYRVFGVVDYPNYIIVAAPKGGVISDLAQVKTATKPLRILADAENEITRVILAYYGITEEATKAGKAVLLGSRPAARKDFDLVVFGGTLSNAPEQALWYEVSQKFDLLYLQMPDDLITLLLKDPDYERQNIPIGLLRGVDRLIPTVARHMNAIYGRADAPDDFAYTVAKAMDEQQHLWMWAPIPIHYNPMVAWKAGGLPLHPGAEKYYREKGYMK